MKALLILSALLFAAVGAQAKLNIVATTPDLGAIAREVGVTDSVHLRLIRKGEAVCVQYEAGGGFRTLRLCTMPGAAAAMIGPMACSPIEGGMNVRFSGFTVGPAVDFASEV